MYRKLVFVVCVPLILGMNSLAMAEVFSDSFGEAHDFATGVAGTIWDGTVGTGVITTADVNHPGQLYLQSVNTALSEPWDAMPPFLYKMVEGDFVATVKITDYAGTEAAPVYHNNCGLMARAALADAGEGEDWISVDYFPIWGCGNMVRMANDGVRSEPCNNGLAWNSGKYLQLERKGDTFYARQSADGQTWTQLCNPFVRKDLANVPVQVGMFQTAFSDAVSYAAFDDFKVETFVNLKAVLKSPEDASRVVGAATLEWTGTADVVAHEVYFGTDLENLESMGLQTETSYVVEEKDLERGTTYYWRVDEVRAHASITTGDVWSFTAGAPIVATLFPVTEGFEQARDFVAQGAEGTFWDGIVGEGMITTADVNHPGQLYLQSANAVWAENWSPLGPYLYKVVKGDFIATVQITDYAGTPDAWVYHNNCGLMARNVNDADAGDGEDWISVDYFPIWSCGNMVRVADNGGRSEPVNNGKAWNAFKFLQLERKGNTFTARISPDGQTWTQLGDPFVREDFNDLPVQIGMAQATFNTETGYAAFDNFVLQTNSFQDGFSAAKDFVADGVAGTNYDGFVGNGVITTAEPNHAGQLFLESVNAAWDAPWTAMGPYLYKVISGNFVATVKVSDYAGDPNNWVYHNNASLMVRNATDADAGAGEDWVSLDYFPVWGCGNFVRSANDGVRAENCTNGQGWNLQPYLQIERVGNTFHFRVSPDGQTWTEMACSPIERKDFDGLSVQVGLTQCTFSDSVGFAAFDDFSIVTSQP